ncbi:MAG: MATE family efflux transporter [Maricaulaceae bacterium]
MSADTAPAANPYLSAPIAPLFLKTAGPIIVVMVLSGLFTVVDAVFIGVFVGARALTAVTLMFPLFMAQVAAGTLVPTGAASVLARRLGAGEMGAAQTALSAAMLLGIVMSLIWMSVFALFGERVIAAAAAGDQDLAHQGYTYVAPLVFGSMLNLVLSVQSDALRSEGRVKAMAALSVGATLLNILFNFLLIAVLDLGVLGSALGTLAAQAVSAGFVLWYRLSGRGRLGFWGPVERTALRLWASMLALGAPASLNFLGASLVSAGVIATVHQVYPGGAEATLAAYGVITRLSAFAFMPLLGLNLAAQSVIGNNFGAGDYARTNAGLRTALLTAIAYAAAAQAVLMTLGGPIGAMFTSDPRVISEVARILPIVFSTYVVVSVTVLLSGYFQAIGEAGRALLLGLAKPYLFSLPLLTILPRVWGDFGIWAVTPASDFAKLVLIVGLLSLNAAQTQRRWGLFYADQRTPTTFG